MATTGASYADALGRAQSWATRGGSSDDVGGADAAAKMAILARLSFGAPVALADVSYEGITEIQPDDIAYAKELGLSLKLLGVAERRGGGISVRVFPCFLYPRHPLAPVEGPFNAVMVEAPTITEITMSGPGAGGVATASAVLGDVVSILSGRAPVHAARATLPIRDMAPPPPATSRWRTGRSCWRGSPRSSARATSRCRAWSSAASAATPAW
jgi:homoserine dehydrogenase